MLYFRKKKTNDKYMKVLSLVMLLFFNFILEGKYLTVCTILWHKILNAKDIILYLDNIIFSRPSSVVCLGRGLCQALACNRYMVIIMIQKKNRVLILNNT